MKCLRLSLLSILFVLAGYSQSKAATDSLHLSNVFADSTEVNIYVSHDANVSLLIYNVWGGTAVIILDNVFLTAGPYSYMLYADSLSAGRYLIRLMVDSNSLAQQLWIFNSVGLKEATQADGISVFPNPAVNNQWQIRVDNKWLGSKAELFDVSGKLVYTTTINSTNETIPADVPQGMYTLKILGKETVMVRLVK